MNWIMVTDNKNKQHMINADNIIDIVYHNDTNLSEIIYLRSAITPVWVTGNIVSELRKAYLSDVIRLGD